MILAMTLVETVGWVEKRNPIFHENHFCRSILGDVGMRSLLGMWGVRSLFGDVRGRSFFMS